MVKIIVGQPVLRSQSTQGCEIDHVYLLSLLALLESSLRGGVCKAALIVSLEKFLIESLLSLEIR